MKGRPPSSSWTIGLRQASNNQKDSSLTELLSWDTFRPIRKLSQVAVTSERNRQLWRSTSLILTPTTTIQDQHRLHHPSLQVTGEVRPKWCIRTASKGKLCNTLPCSLSLIRFVNAWAPTQLFLEMVPTLSKARWSRHPVVPTMTAMLL